MVDKTQIDIQSKSEQSTTPTATIYIDNKSISLHACELSEMNVDILHKVSNCLCGNKDLDIKAESGDAIDKYEYITSLHTTKKL